MSTFILGDCSYWLQTIPKIHLTITSPPYFNVKDYVNYPSYEEYLDILRKVFREILVKTENGRMCCVNISNILISREKRSAESSRIPLAFHFVSLMEGLGWKFIEDIVWLKPEGSAKNRNGGFYRHRKPVAWKPNIVNEYIFVFQKPGKSIDAVVKGQTHKVEGSYERTNVWKINTVCTPDHPAPFPPELVRRLVEYYSYPNETVLDPYSGTGTTCRVAKSLARNAIGIEKDDTFFWKAVSKIV